MSIHGGDHWTYSPCPRRFEEVVSASHRGFTVFSEYLDTRITLETADPTPATHAILTQLKAGECIRHSI